MNRKYDPSKFYDIPGFGGRYEINIFAVVRRKKNNRIAKSRISGSYNVVSLTTVEGKHRVFRLHTLMGRTFLRPLKEGEMYYHLNQNKLDDFITNLGICTKSEMYKRISSMGTRGKAVIQVDENGNEINSFRTARVASKELFLSMPQVLARCNGKMKRKVAPFLHWDKTKRS